MEPRELPTTTSPSIKSTRIRTSIHWQRVWSTTWTTTMRSTSTWGTPTQISAPLVLTCSTTYQFRPNFWANRPFPSPRLTKRGPKGLRMRISPSRGSPTTLPLPTTFTWSKWRRTRQLSMSTRHILHGNWKMKNRKGLDPLFFIKYFHLYLLQTPDSHNKIQ